LLTAALGGAVAVGTIIDDLFAGNGEEQPRKVLVAATPTPSPTPSNEPTLTIGAPPATRTEVAQVATTEPNQNEAAGTAFPQTVGEVADEQPVFSLSEAHPFYYGEEWRERIENALAQYSPEDLVAVAANDYVAYITVKNLATAIEANAETVYGMINRPANTLEELFMFIPEESWDYFSSTVVTEFSKNENMPAQWGTHGLETNLATSQSSILRYEGGGLRYFNPQIPEAEYASDVSLQVGLAFFDYLMEDLQEDNIPVGEVAANYRNWFGQTYKEKAMQFFGFTRAANPGNYEFITHELEDGTRVPFLLNENVAASAAIRFVPPFEEICRVDAKAAPGNDNTRMGQFTQENELIRVPITVEDKTLQETTDALAEEETIEFSTDTANLPWAMGVDFDYDELRAAILEKHTDANGVLRLPDAATLVEDIMNYQSANGQPDGEGYGLMELFVSVDGRLIPWRNIPEVYEIAQNMPEDMQTLNNWLDLQRQANLIRACRQQSIPVFIVSTEEGVLVMPSQPPATVPPGETPSDRPPEEEDEKTGRGLHNPDGALPGDMPVEAGEQLPERESPTGDLDGDGLTGAAEDEDGDGTGDEDNSGDTWQDEADNNGGY